MDPVTQSFEVWLADLVAAGRNLRAAQIASYVDGYLAQFGRAASTERIRLCRAFADRAPDTDLARPIIAELSK
jgi:hypothetical protein